MGIWGGIAVGLFALWATGTPVQTAEEPKQTQTEVIYPTYEDNYTLQVDLSEELLEPKTTHSISVNFVVDKGSVPEKVNYHDLIAHMNRSYAEADLSFKANEVQYLDTLKETNYSTILKSMPSPKGEITVYLVGFHEGETVGRAALNGFFLGAESVIVDITATSTIQGKANMISHEIGHLFGLDHEFEGSIMQTQKCEHEIKFKKSNLRKINKRLHNYVGR